MSGVIPSCIPLYIYISVTGAQADSVARDPKDGELLSPNSPPVAPLTISIASIIQAAGCDATVCRNHHTFIKNHPYIFPSWNIKQQMLLWAILFLDN